MPIIIRGAGPQAAFGCDHRRWIMVAMGLVLFSGMGAVWGERVADNVSRFR